MSIEGQPPIAPEPDLVPVRGDARDAPLNRSGLFLIALAVTLLVIGIVVVQFGLLVAEMLAQSVWLGSITAVLFAVGVVLLAVGIWRELAGLFSLASNELWREELLDPETSFEERKIIVAQWLSLLDRKKTPAAEAIAGLDAAAGIEDVEDLLRSGVLRSLDAEVSRISTTAAYRTVAAKLLLDSAALESLVFFYFTLRLLRQIGELHGMRPGFIASLRLYRRVILDSSLLLGVDFVAEAAVDIAASNKLVELIGSRAPGAGVAYVRVKRFGKVAALACCPLPPRPRSGGLIGTAQAAALAVHNVARSSVRSGSTITKRILRSVGNVILRPRRLFKRS